MATVDDLNAEIVATYKYDYPPNPELCARFIQAVRGLMIFRPQFVTIDGNQVTFAVIKSMYQDAQDWLAAHPIGSSTADPAGSAATTYYGTNNIRGH
jgi:hypothetical protein